MNNVVGGYRFPFVCDAEELAFARVKLHFVLYLPFLEFVKVILKFDSICGSIDCAIHAGIVCKESDGRAG